MSYLSVLPDDIYGYIMKFLFAEVIQELDDYQGFVLIPPRRNASIGRIMPVKYGYIYTFKGCRVKGDDARMFVNTYVPQLGQHCDGSHLKRFPSIFRHQASCSVGTYIYVPTLFAKDCRIIKTQYAIITFININTVPVNCLALSSQMTYRMNLFAPYSMSSWVRYVNPKMMALEEFLLDFLIY